MPGPLDILKSLAGTHGAKGKGAGAPGAGIPALDDATIKGYIETGKALEGIRSSMRGIAQSGGAEGLKKLSEHSRKMVPLQKAIKDVLDAEVKYIEALQSESTTIEQQVKLYNELSAAKKQQVRMANEAQGAWGRLKNVADDLRANKWALIWAAGIRDLMKVADSMNRGFDVMARSGQALDQSFGSLAETTGRFTLNMKMASLQASLFGHSAKDSEAVFAMLTEALGGTADAVEHVSSQFGDMAKIAKFSGMGMAEAAAFAEKNWKRLGKTMQESNEDLSRMGLSTANLNKLFGAGSVNTREFAQTVSDLSFQSGSYNQNTKFLTESLNHELAVQLSLGKTREAAMHSAKQNLEEAGKANIAGTLAFGKVLQAEFEAGGKTVQDYVDRFGAEGEVLFEMLQSGGVTTGKNLLGFQQLIKDSSEMQGTLQDMIRRDAAQGGTLAAVAGLGMGTQQKLMAQERVRERKFDKIRQAEGTKATTEALKALFPTSDVSGEKFQKFAATLQSDPRADARAAFRKAVAITPGKAEDPIDTFLSKISKNGTWFAKALGMFTTMAGALRELPGSLMGLMALMHGPRALSGVAKKLGAPVRAVTGAFRGVGGAVGGQLARIPGVSRAAGIAGKGFRMARGAAGGAALAAGIITSAYQYQNAFRKAGEILGKNEDEVTSLDRTTVAAAAAVNGILLGLPKLIFGDDFVKNFAGAMTKPADWIADAIFGGRDKGATAAGKYEAAKERGSVFAQGTEAEYTAAMARLAAQRTFGATLPPTATDQAQAVADSAARGMEAAARPASGKAESPPISRPGAPAGGAGVSTGVASVTGGKLILEVDNWPSVLAQSQNELSALPNG